jgi:hypothetical protein
VHYHARSYTVISVDIVNSSEGGTLRHTNLVTALDEAIGSAVADCPLGAKWLIRRDGDSMTIAVPPDVGTGEVLGELPHRVDREVRRYNFGRTPESQLWIRMAVTHGDITVDGDRLLGGDPLVEAARIRDIDPLRAAMAAAPQAYLGLVLTDEVYRTSVREGDPALMPDAYRRVAAEAKNYDGSAWVRLLGAESSGDDGTGGAREPRSPVPGPAPGGRTITTNVGHNEGIVQTGDNPAAVIYRA